jgi:phosphoglycolate phosphatase-like HAD superfamily hydrolase
VYGRSAAEIVTGIVGRRSKGDLIRVIKSIVHACRVAATALALLCVLSATAHAQAAADPLPSWNDGPAKQSILKLVAATTTPGSAEFVAPGDRFATFDQDGTLWVEQPIYTQAVFSMDRVIALAPHHPEWKTVEPFKSVIAGDRAAIAKFTTKDLEKILFATHTGMTTGEFTAIVKDWIAKAQNPRWHRPFTDLIYQPMLEVMEYLRANGYRTYIVTGGGQDFVRTYADRTYGIPPEQIIGSALDTELTYNDAGKAILMRPPKLLLNNNFSGKPEDIYLFIGRHPQAAFGNSTGDREMLEYTQAGGKGALLMLVLHDDPVREYAYGPAEGLPASKVGTFTQALYDEAQSKGWNVISMKKDWKRIFSFDK